MQTQTDEMELEIQSFKQAIVDKDNQLLTFSQRITTLETELEAKETELSNLRKAMFDREVKDLVQVALSQNKLLPGQVQSFSKLASLDLDAARAFINQKEVVPALGAKKIVQSEQIALSSAASKGWFGMTKEERQQPKIDDPSTYEAIMPDNIRRNALEKAK